MSGREMAANTENAEMVSIVREIKQFLTMPVVVLPKK